MDPLTPALTVLTAMITPASEPPPLAPTRKETSMLRNLRERAHGGEPLRGYQMREKLIDIGDDFWIENADGQRAFKVDGKALRLRNTLNLEDPQGRVLYQIQERILRLRDTMAI